MRKVQRSFSIPASLLSAACLIAVVAGCSHDRADGAPPPSAQRGESAARLGAGVLAMVGDAPITTEDVRYWLERNQVQRIDRLPPEQIANVLQTLIRQELLAQRAEELGLDADAGYQERVRRKQAEVSGLRRVELSRKVSLGWSQQQAEVSEEAVQQYFDTHSQQLRTLYHVQQLMTRSRGEAVQLRQRLSDGATFEDLAAQFHPEPPSGARPVWDMGSLRWEQLPEPWQATIDALAVGEVSDVVQGESDRYWLLRVVAKDPAPEATFDSVKTTLQAMLTRQKAAKLRATLEEDLRRTTPVVIATDLSLRADHAPQASAGPPHAP